MAESVKWKFEDSIHPSFLGLFERDRSFLPSLLLILHKEFIVGSGESATSVKLKYGGRACDT